FPQNSGSEHFFEHDLSGKSVRLTATGSRIRMEILRPAIENDARPDIDRKYALTPNSRKNVL
ncbi:hypothetical protein NX783_26855, partial [Massilia kyonggiensis]|nr:hypothetical protein [Massilia kyonggiensis]